MRPVEIMIIHLYHNPFTRCGNTLSCVDLSVFRVDAQIYIFALYTRPKFTQPTFTPNPNLHKPKFTPDPNLHAPRFTPPQIYKTQIYTNPDIHSLHFTQNPNFHSPKITQTPILQHQNLHQIIPNIFFLMYYVFHHISGHLPSASFT